MQRSILADLCKEFNLAQPLKPDDDQYRDIENFKDFEYTYCIAYEMLIRTTEYQSLLDRYNEVIQITNEIMDDKTNILNDLVRQMEKLGLNKDSFINLGYENRNIFEKIKLYNELKSNPLSNVTLDGFEDGLQQVIAYYINKEELYFAKSSQNGGLIFEKDTIIDSINALLNHENYYIPLNDKNSSDIIYKSLKEKIYLEELDEDCLSALNLVYKQKDMLVQVKSVQKTTVDFWHRYSLDDLHGGLGMLITFYINRNAIKQCKNDGNSKNNITFIDVCRNITNYCIPCVEDTSMDNKLIFKPINKNMPLKMLDSTFLSILEISDLKTNSIETIPIFSRPQLFFASERIIKLPINLNLSKDELVSYISQIKDEYDDNKNIVKNQIESLFDSVLKSDTVQMPNSLKKFPTEREKFKKSFALAFYVYDMYEFFYPLFEKKRINLSKAMNSEIMEKKEFYKNYTDRTNMNNSIKEIEEKYKDMLGDYAENALITYISEYANISEDKFTYFIATMKEFIQGINTNDENDKSKRKQNTKKFEHPEPKYKNIIIGNSFNDYFKKTTIQK